MPLTDLPRPLPVNLETIRQLIVERAQAITVSEGIIEGEKKAITSHREEMELLQSQAKKLLLITPPVITDKEIRDKKSGERLDKNKGKGNNP